jgi:hypothetical protein
MSGCFTSICQLFFGKPTNQKKQQKQQNQKKQKKQKSTNNDTILIILTTMSRCSNELLKHN